MKIPGLWRIDELKEKLNKYMSYGYERLYYRRLPVSQEFEKKRIVFIGASVAKQWMIEIRFPFIKVISEYQFNKTAVINNLINSCLIPDGIIIKECAAYFPGDIEKYKNLIEQWTKEISEKSIRLAFATVVPVTKNHSLEHPGRIDQIWEFNNWLRKFTNENKIPLLDLEESLIIGDNEKYLKDDYAQPDGLHLNRKVYREILDPVMNAFIAGVFLC